MFEFDLPEPLAFEEELEREEVDLSAAPAHHGLELVQAGHGGTGWQPLRRCASELEDLERDALHVRTRVPVFRRCVRHGSLHCVRRRESQVCSRYFHWSHARMLHVTSR